MTHKKPPFTTLDSEIVWSCPWYRVRRDRVQLPDGTETPYNVVEKPDSVWVVPVLPNGDLVLIYNYRQTLGVWCWEVPAGHIEAGQSPEETARRELREEIGGTTESLRFLMRVSTDNGISSQYGSFFLATGVTLDAPDHEPTEVITIHTIPLQKAVAMAYSGEMNDAISVMALLVALPHLQAETA